MGTVTLPYVLTAGQPEDVNQLMADLNALMNAMNGNLDAINLATSAKPATLLGQYRTLTAIDSMFTNGASATRILSPGNGFVSSGVANSVPKAFVPIAAADLAVTGLTAKLRLRGYVGANATAPGINFIFGLYPVTAMGGAVNAHSVTIGVAVSGSATAAASPAGGANQIVVGSDFSLPADGLYVLGVSLSGTIAANADGVLGVRLQVRHV